MAIVVESTATATIAAAASITINKPSGLTVGDLMVSVISVADTDNVSTLSGWTQAIDQSGDTCSVNVQYKVADSGDVAASDFTFSIPGSAIFAAGGIMRISGANNLSPIEDSDGDFDNAASGTTVGPFSTTISPNHNGTLLILGFSTNDADAGGPSSTSSYAVSDGTVLFTELFDYGPDGSASFDPALSAAYGIQSTATALTTFSAVTSVAKDNQTGVIVAITPAIDADASNTFFSTSSQVFGQTATADTTTNTTALLEATAETFTQNGATSSPTQWANESKPTTIWQNEAI